MSLASGYDELAEEGEGCELLCCSCSVQSSLPMHCHQPTTFFMENVPENAPSQKSLDPSTDHKSFWSAQLWILGKRHGVRLSAPTRPTECGDATLEGCPILKCQHEPPKVHCKIRKLQFWAFQKNGAKSQCKCPESPLN